MSEELRAAEIEWAEHWAQRAEAVGQMQQANVETMQRLAAQGIGIGDAFTAIVGLAVLVEQLLGGPTEPRRIEYEEAMHTKLAQLLEEAGRQVARSKLLQGVPGVRG